MLGFEEALLVQADTMLAAARAAHGDGAMDQSLIEGFARLPFLRSARIDHQRNVEVAVAHVAQHCRSQAAGRQVRASFGDALGELRNGYAGVGREHPAARP